MLLLPCVWFFIFGWEKILESENLYHSHRTEHVRARERGKTVLTRLLPARWFW